MFRPFQSTENGPGCLSIIVSRTTVFTEEVPALLVATGCLVVGTATQAGKATEHKNCQNTAGTRRKGDEIAVEGRGNAVEGRGNTVKLQWKVEEMQWKVKERQ